MFSSICFYTIKFCTYVNTYIYIYIFIYLFIYIHKNVQRKTNLMHDLFLVYFVNFYVFDVLVGLFQSNQDNRQSSKRNNKYQLLYM